VISIILGTAQWGLDYGITNEAGRLSDETITSVVDEARRSGIHGLDTAPAYGDAQLRCARWSGEFSIATKVSGVLGRALIAQLEQSLVDLGLTSVDRCLIHDWPSLDDPGRAVAVDALTDARRQGLVREIGVSVYGHEDLAGDEWLRESLSVVQLPVNVLDQRLDGAEVIAHVRDRGWTVQARSIFLQGLLAGDSGSRLSQHPDVQGVRRAAERLGTSTLQLAAAYVATRRWVDEIVLGVTSAAELRKAVSALTDPVDLESVLWSDLASMDLDLIDPRRW
jgi:aryl-alcohol dehydrogenase-like predicted oxidoreductase